MERIGFIGAGMMGSGICSSLLAAGHPVAVVAHRNRARIDKLLAAGATEAGDAAALAAAADVVMICVNSADTVEATVSAMRRRLAKGSVIIDITTSKPDTSRRLAASLAADGVLFVDAPVIGTPEQAAQGQLATLVGGSPEAFTRTKPILDRYSSEIVYFGPPGAGHAAKLLANTLSIGLRVLITQVFRAARRNEVDLEKLYRVIQKGSANSGALTTMVGEALAGNYKSNQFTIANCLKDMSYAVPLLAGDADGAGLQQAFVDAYRRLVDAGLGDHLVSEMMNPEIEALTRR